MSTEKRKYELKARAERWEATRRRIVEATLALHREVGPARTTVAEIARRAGVQRLTVYNHFPRESELFDACQRRFLTEHPLPDLASALALEDPRERTHSVLRGLYASYRERESVTEKVLRDRALVPALDALLERTMDAQQRQLGDALAAAFGARGARRRRLRALVAVALDFWTWQRLTQHGLGDASAADVMTGAVIAASAMAPRPPRRDRHPERT